MAARLRRLTDHCVCDKATPAENMAERIYRRKSTVVMSITENISLTFFV